MSHSGDHEGSIAEIPAGSPFDLELRSRRVRPPKSKALPYVGPDWDKGHPLSALFDSLPIDRFLRSIWGRDVFHFKAGDPNRFSRYFSEESLLNLWSSVGLEVGRRGVMGKGPPFYGAEQLDRGLSELVRGFEDLTGLSGTLDLYHRVTQKNELGEWHWDTKDKFLIQLEGGGILEIYEGFASNLLEGQDLDLYPHIARGEMKLRKKILRRQGDVVYIPRGVPHRHCFNAGESVHAALWLSLTTWHDIVTGIVSDALRSCEADPEFRKTCAFPRDGKETRSHVDRLLKKLTAACEPELAEYYYNVNQIRAQKPNFNDIENLRRSILALRDLSAKSIFKRTRRRVSLRAYNGEVELATGDIKLYFPEGWAAAVKYALSGKPFRFADLSRFRLGKGARELVERMVENLVLEIQADK